MKERERRSEREGDHKSEEPQKGRENTVIK